MKKQFAKIKIAAENLSRSTKSDCKDSELETIEKQVDRYRDTIEKIVRKLPALSSGSSSSSSSNGQVSNEEHDKRIKKNSHYKIAQALDESARELPKDMPLQKVLSNCGELEKTIAECSIESELETETKVVRRLKNILDKEIQEISTLKRNVSRTLQEYTSLKRSHEAAIRLEEPAAKVNNIKSQQEECELKLEKERDAWAAQMLELIAKEDEIVNCIRDYVLNQRNYHERALQHVNASLARIQDTIQSTEKSRFGTSLKEHLSSNHRDISYIVELCCCCLLEHGLEEEGLLRVGCASTKLRRMKHALEAQHVKTPLPLEYQDPHVIGSILKLYLRELPEPLLTYALYKDFIKIAERHTEAERKTEIKAILGKLPKENYVNLRYLTRFLALLQQRAVHNKMNSQNLAIVMSPNMLWPRVDKSSNAAADYIGQVNSSSAANIIVELLISQWDYFFDGEVEFYLTLQRQKLFVEGKSKSNSSNEHLDKHESEVIESPRYGTLRRQKPNAPSPPTKNEATTNGGGTTNHSHSTRPHAKELFPQQPSQQQDDKLEKQEKPAKPPLPNLAQFQQPATQSAVSQPTHTQLEPLPPPPVTPAKPVPMTRTQFFGLDNLPSPTADRRSIDSIGSFRLKPDLPQKPQLPKRPTALGVGGGNGVGYKSDSKSDDESITPTQAHIDNGNSTVRFTTEKFIDQLRQENCYTNGTREEPTTNPIATTSTSTTSTTTVTSAAAGKEQNHNHNHEQDPANNAQKEQQTPTTPISPNSFQTPKRPTVPAPPPPMSLRKQVD
ncbi:rho GTPase-activating protein 92B isoform X1 [Drosophila sulfurigaster albostrigata]|uniref:rho GTPase-activating protein 92B isoform X1 n=1 Tax=Drosophila sulfurigaster albostrigata TaxID=89887 RepID=UPI002D21EDDB|nr:rho GTPase-activating protein 92B isoform X1 [Drosophila sulfurigaster albostrigata]